MNEDQCEHIEGYNVMYEGSYVSTQASCLHIFVCIFCISCTRQSTRVLLGGGGWL